MIDSMTMLDADENRPMRASLLSEIEGITRETVLKAIEERRIVFHDVSDVEALYTSGLLNAEDIKHLLESAIYIPKGDERRRLIDLGILSEDEAHEIRHKIVYRLRFD